MDFETAVIKNNIEQAITAENHLPATQPEFTIDSDEKVEWFSAKIKSNKLRIENQEKILAAKLKQLDEIRESFIQDFRDSSLPYKTEIERLIVRFGMQVLHYVNSTLPRRSKSRTIAGLSIGMRKKADTIIMDDEQAVIGWLTRNPEAIPEGAPVAVELKVKKSALNEIYKSLREISPENTITGATYIAGTNFPYIKLGDTELLDLYGATPTDAEA